MDQDSTPPPKRQQIYKNLLMTAKLPALDVFCDLLGLNPETICALNDHQIDVYNLMKKNYYELDDIKLSDDPEDDDTTIAKEEQTKIKDWIKARYQQAILTDEAGEDKLMVFKDFWEMSIATHPPTLEHFCKVLKFTDFTMCLFLQTDITPTRLTESPEMVTQTMPALGFDPIICERTAKWLTTQKRKKEHLNQYSSSSNSTSRISSRPPRRVRAPRSVPSLFSAAPSEASDHFGGLANTSVNIQYQHTNTGNGGVVGHLSALRRSPFHTDVDPWFQNTMSSLFSSSPPTILTTSTTNHSSSRSGGRVDFSEINDAPQSVSTSDKEVSQECVVCLDKKKTVLILPCKHLCVCSLCVKRLKKCPVCRKGIQKALDVYQ